MIEFKFMLALLRANPSAYPVSKTPSLHPLVLTRLPPFDLPLCRKCTYASPTRTGSSAF